MRYQLEIIQTIIAIVMLFIVAQATKRLVKSYMVQKKIDPNRKKIILNMVYLLLYIVLGISIAIVWGVDFKDFSVFISSVLAVLGVGFFAQWSILSNLTSSVILFFNHPMRIGDRIRVIDKDYNWVGEVKDITGFYVYMKTDDGQNITLPTSLVLQKGIEIL